MIWLKLVFFLLYYGAYLLLMKGMRGSVDTLSIFIVGAFIMVQNAYLHRRKREPVKNTEDTENKE